jgi:hypothetical protein
MEFSGIDSRYHYLLCIFAAWHRAAGIWSATHDILSTRLGKCHSILYSSSFSVLIILVSCLPILSWRNIRYTHAASRSTRYVVSFLLLQLLYMLRYHVVPLLLMSDISLRQVRPSLPLYLYL